MERKYYLLIFFIKGWGEKIIKRSMVDRLFGNGFYCSYRFGYWIKDFVLNLINEFRLLQKPICNLPITIIQIWLNSSIHDHIATELVREPLFRTFLIGQSGTRFACWLVFA